VYSPTPVSKYELAVMIADVFQSGTKVIGVETENTLDKTLASTHPDTLFPIIPLYNQLQELALFNLST
jgi:hypothetical protein